MTETVISLILVCIGTALCWAIWPEGITDLPLASLNIGMIARAILAVWVGIGFMEAAVKMLP